MPAYNLCNCQLMSVVSLQAASPGAHTLVRCLHREKFPLFISQDGTNEAVHELAVTYAPGIKYLNHVEDAPPARKST